MNDGQDDCWLGILEWLDSPRPEHLTRSETPPEAASRAREKIESTIERNMKRLSHDLVPMQVSFGIPQPNLSSRSEEPAVVCVFIFVQELMNLGFGRTQLRQLTSLV